LYDRCLKVCHVSPKSLDFKIRAFLPPEAIQTVLPIVLIFVLLAAKTAFPSVNLGEFIHGILLLVLPPSEVKIIDGQSSIGTPTAISWIPLSKNYKVL
jgi:hypothetical protein